jgi:hypothetical protein
MTAKKFSPEEVKHLEFIQGVVTRMNSNSFQMKGWMVAILSAILALFASTHNYYFILIAILSTVIFWFLDTYYLWQERKFRGLYNDVAGLSKDSKKIELFAMRPDLYTGGKYSFWDVFGSVTVLPLYTLVILVLLAVYFFL